MRSLAGVLPRATALVLALAAMLALARPAAADISLEGAAADTSGTVKGAGAVSIGLIGVPLTPISGELTVLVRSGGGYAATADARLSLAGTTIGAGAGFGTLGAAHSAGIYDALLAHGILPHTALEARWYFGPSRKPTFTAGIRLSF